MEPVRAVISYARERMNPTSSSPHTLDVERNDGKLGMFVVDCDIWFLLQFVIEERCLPFRFDCNRVNTNIPPQGIQ